MYKWEFLKKSWAELSEEMKIVAALYIEDMGSGNTRTESKDMESKLNNKNYPDWISDCANFVSQCLDAGKKVIKNVVSNISA